MSRVIFSSGLLMAVLAVVFALAVFLSKTLFDEARATASDFRIHERVDLETTARIQARQDFLERRIEEVSRGVQQANKKLDLLVEKHLK